MRESVPKSGQWRRVLTWYLAIEWWVVGVCLAASFALGYFGIRAACQTGPSLLDICSPWLNDSGALRAADVAYLTTQLFGWESGSQFGGGNLPWSLAIARFMAPIVLGYAAIRALVRFFADQMQPLRAAFRRQHIVIAGNAGHVLPLAREFRSTGWRPVLVIDDDAAAVTSGRGYGPVIKGASTHERTLRTAGVRRARHVIAVGPEDMVNVETCATALASDPAHLTCHAHISDLALWESLRTREITAPKDRRGRLQFFNSFDLVARAAMTTIAAELSGDGVRSHLLVAGWTPVTEQLIVRSTMWWRLHPQSGKALTITVVDRDAGRELRELTSRYPAIERSCVLEPVDVDITLPAFRTQAVPRVVQSGGIGAACVAASTDAAGIMASRCLLEATHSEHFPVVVCATNRAGVELLLTDVAATAVRDRLSVVCTVGDASSPALILDSTSETLARAIHEMYRRQRDRSGHGEPNPSLETWERLDEGLRDSNRAQADHIIDKLEQLRCVVTPLLDWDVQLERFTDDEVERLARSEHDRWVRERKAAGWTFGETKDVPGKRSPYLTEWERLPPKIQDIDQRFVEAIPELLARVGVGIARRTS